jgi:hypothetical protein
VAAHVPSESVAVIGSLSKLFWGGLRVGFVRAPEAVARRIARVKATQDLGSSAVGQLLAEKLLRSESIVGFGGQRRIELRARYALLARKLHEALPSWSWTEPAGGLSLWVRGSRDPWPDPSHRSRCVTASPSPPRNRSRRAALTLTGYASPSLPLPTWSRKASGASLEPGTTCRPTTTSTASLRDRADACMTG